MKVRRAKSACFSVVAMVALALPGTVHMPYQLLYNPSESAPRGWYVVVPVDEVRVDDFVVVRLPSSVAAFAAQRKYLPLTVPLLKHVAAMSGQRVCALAPMLMIDDSIVAYVRDRDGAGRTLTPWVECRSLFADELLLLSPNIEASFDSRYFGPVHRSNVIGRAIPLWTW